MKLVFTTVLFSLFFAANTQASTAAFRDPCVGPDIQANSYLVTVNEEDGSDRDDLLKALRLLATPGFTPEYIFDQDGPVVVTVNFDPTYYANAAEGKRIKLAALKNLSETNGVSISCNQVAHPTPRIGTSN